MSTLDISPEIGAVSTAFVIPDDPIAIMTLAHGAGAGMHHSFMVSLADELRNQGIATLRFNFPFAENKKGRPDFPAVAHKVIEKALEYASETHRDLPLFLSGKSFGGRMSSQFLATHNTDVRGIIFYGFPLHPPKKPSTERADHLKKIQQPMLFLQGTKDQLAEWGLIENVCASLTTATLKQLEGADHAFKKGKENLIPQLAVETKRWLEPLVKHRLG